MKSLEQMRSIFRRGQGWDALAACATTTKEGLCRGEYIWLISADDYLKSLAVLQRYVRLYGRCADNRLYDFPGYSVIDGQEREIVGAYGHKDAVVKGHVFLKTLFDSNFVLAASVMVRRKCYEGSRGIPAQCVLARPSG
jgi:hypothetical protein